MSDILPDSRLLSEVGTVLVDWPGFGRVECVPVFCANCGAPHGYVPKENTTFSFWLCQPCFETYGTIADTMVMPDHEFWQDVEQEMLTHFGHALDPTELLILEQQGWGPLASLAKASPIKVYS